MIRSLRTDRIMHNLTYNLSLDYIVASIDWVEHLWRQNVCMLHGPPGGVGLKDHLLALRGVSRHSGSCIYDV